MKRLLINMLAFLSLVPSLSAAEGENAADGVDIRTVKVGTFSQDDAALKGKQYVWGTERVLFTRYDEKSNTLLLRTDKGFARYPLGKEALLWRYGVHRDYPAHFVGNGILTFGEEEIVYLDQNSGELLWSRPMSDGVRFYEYFMEDESSLFAVTTTLRQIDLNSGKGWELEVDKKQRIKNASKPNHVGVGMRSLFGPADQLMSESLVSVEPDGSEYRAQYVSDGEFIYYAKPNGVIKIEKKTGKKVWENSLSFNTNGEGAVFAKDDTTLFFMNKGAHSSWGTVEPYFRAIYKENGKPVADTSDVPYGDEVKGYEFSSFMEADSMVYALGGGRISLISKDSLAIKEDILVKGSGNVRMDVFLDAKDLYYGENAAFTAVYDSACVFVCTGGELLAVKKEHLTVLNRYDLGNIWKKIIETDKFALYTNNGSSVFVNVNTGDYIAETKTITEACVRNNCLCAVVDGVYTEIKLDDIVKPEVQKGKKRR